MFLWNCATSLASSKVTPPMTKTIRVLQLYPSPSDGLDSGQYGYRISSSLSLLNGSRIDVCSHDLCWSRTFFTSSPNIEFRSLLAPPVSEVLSPNKSAFLWDLPAYWRAQSIKWDWSSEMRRSDFNCLILSWSSYLKAYKRTSLRASNLFIPSLPRSD